MAGLLFGELRELQSGVQKFMKDADELTLKLELQKDILSLPLQCPRYGEVLVSLIRQSAAKFHAIPNVSALAYLDVLKNAITHSDEYQGVQRRPPRWFLEEHRNGETYLETLRDSEITRKTRIFVIDDEDIPAMEEDIASSVMGRYWELTGADTETYWIPLTHLRRFVPGMDEPRDCAVYDRCLFIEYDSDTHLLSFDVLADAPSDRRVEIFRVLGLQGRHDHHRGPFIRLEPPAPIDIQAPGTAQ